MEISDRLRSARIALGMSVPEFIAHTGIPFGSYQKYEGGQRKSISAKNLNKLVSAGISERWLVSGVEPVLSKDRPAIDAFPSVASEPAPDNDLGQINRPLMENCLRACQAVHGEPFKAMSALDQLGYAADLYNLIVRMMKEVGGSPKTALRLEVAGLADQLRVFLRMEWMRSFPPPLF